MNLRQIGGVCDCPYFARIELLADKLASSLPNFKVTKLVKQASEWEEFTNWVLKEHGWEVKKSPVVWRELLDRGGVGTLIGDADEFQEYAAAYYDEFSQMPTEELLKVAADTSRFLLMDKEEHEEHITKSVPPSKIIVIGACCNASVHLLPYFSQYGLFSATEKIVLHLYDDSANDEDLRELVESLKELDAPLLVEVKIETELSACLVDAKQIIFLNIVPRMRLNVEESMSCPTKTTNSTFVTVKSEPRNQWLKRRYTFLTAIGMLIKAYCSSSVRVLVAGNPGLDAESNDSPSPINFDVAVLHKATAPHIPCMQIVGLAAALEQRIKSTLAVNLEVSPNNITDVVIWGNIGSRIYIDLSLSHVYQRHAYDVGVQGGDWYSVPTLEAIRDPEWLAFEMPSEAFKKRTKAISNYLGFSHAQAIIRTLESWWRRNVDDKEGVQSLVIASEEWYGVPRGVVFSFPVNRSPKSSWSVVQDVEISPAAALEIESCVKDVLQDWTAVDPEPLERYMESRKGKRHSKLFLRTYFRRSRETGRFERSIYRRMTV
ncbi:hypothetical protein CRM22_008362 [Opisthorchis felineus]|uniref:Lactate/malate dehydrogenase C-terminal domain-containing protein n=1 Tax=Opisthorchis felineus TaxID=147828 RepID=A0A4S2LBK5_OPIFE|nr:hypothetical protein CRM22_008362 [Opisthorchis felineus]